MMRWAAELFGSPFKICSAIAMRLGGIFAQRHLGLGDLRRGAGAAQHFFEEAPAAVAGLAELGVAQRLAAVEKARLHFQRLVQQRDGVIEVVPLTAPASRGRTGRARRAKFRSDVFSGHKLR